MNNASAVQQDNAGKLRPFDAAKCKPGDPVVRVRNGVKRRARFVAYVEGAIPEHRALTLEEDGVVHAFTVDGRWSKGLDPEVFLPPLDPLDEVDPSPGNVDKLTRRQVGVGYRIPAHDEPAPGGEYIWLPDSHYWKERTAGGDPYCRGSTYRVPIAPAMVPLDQSDIVLGSMKIEVGKKYLNGYGDVVEITSHSPGERYPYAGVWGDDVVTYTEDGVFDSYDPEAKASLVSELGNVATPATPAPAFSPTQVSRLLDALNLAYNGCSTRTWEDALVALEEALCPEEEAKR